MAGSATYSGLFLEVRRKLRELDFPAADLEARELVCRASGKSREELLRDGGLYVPQETVDQAWALTDRHIKGEPVAYIIGEWEFYGLTLDVTPDVLIPRPDTEVLAKTAIRRLRLTEKDQCRVLDLCAGTGCVGLAVASQVPWARVVLGEYVDAALKICHRNILRCGLTGRVSSMKLDASRIPSGKLGKFHCIVSNPPYIPRNDIALLDASVRDYEPHTALDGGKDGLIFFRTIAKKWKRVLHPGGLLMFEVGLGQAYAVRGIMTDEGYRDIQIQDDLNHIPRVVWGVKPEA